MTFRKPLAIFSFLILGSFLMFGVGWKSSATVMFHDDDDDGHGATLTVDDDHVQCPSAAFTSIQAAVLVAAPGDRIRVCPGTYHEQVNVTKPLTIEGVEVANQKLAVIMPSPALANSTSLTSGNPIAAIILVDGTRKVNLTNLTVDGSTNGINTCGTTLVGIYYRNSSGTVDSVAARHITLGPGAQTCDGGLGVFAQSGNGGKAKVDVLNSSVHDYQKVGIAGNEVGTEIRVWGNSVSGLGSHPTIAQNGIQLAFGARGTIEKNSVINHIYAQCTAPDTCSFFAANILVVDSDQVSIINNNTGNAQVNIYYQGNKGDVLNNTVFQSRVFDGIDLVGNRNRASGNKIFNSEASGVYVLGNRNVVEGNTINETPVGILQDSPSSDNHFAGNRFFNTGMKIVREPSSAAALTLQSLAPAMAGKKASAAQP